MKYSKYFGVSAPENGWVPAPRYILRRNIVLNLLKEYPPGKVLEIGSGTGALLFDLSKKGFYGNSVEKSDQAREIALKILSGINDFKIKKNLPDSERGTFDYLLSFEVLEHIKDDESALKNWVNYLKSSGIAVISVPANMSKWGERDIWAGHYRRYEKNELLKIIEDAGLKTKGIYNYGWPLSSFLSPIIECVYRKKNRTENAFGSGEKNKKRVYSSRTYRSGIERSTDLKLFPLYNNFIGKFFFLILGMIQKLFFNFELGDGYIIVAESKKRVKKIGDDILV